jgi:phosphoribosylamine--glycine ligase
MRLLLIGSGGREHALAWKLTREEPDLELIAEPGNPGIAELGECVPINALDFAALERLARERDVDLTVVGPEAPLEAGIVDRFRALGLPIFGPTRAAAEIETSKAFAKQLLQEEGIPTGRAEIHTTVAGAKAAARRFGAPVVVKASGLAAGKGVIVCKTLGDADTAIDDMLEGNRFGPAGAEVLVEEFMHGEEVSLFAITDGNTFVVLPGLQDHKRLLANDLGPNTGGMGAYLPVQLGYDADHEVSSDPDAAASLVLQAARDIFAPTLRGLSARGRPFSGLLYAGLMLTPTGPKVVEFNCRFGDPETQALMPVLDISPRLIDLMLAVGRGHPLLASRCPTRTGRCQPAVPRASRPRRRSVPA